MVVVVVVVVVVLLSESVALVKLRIRIDLKEILLVFFPSPKLESAADVPILRPIVREIGLSVVSVVP